MKIAIDIKTDLAYAVIYAPEGFDNWKAIEQLFVNAGKDLDIEVIMTGHAPDIHEIMCGLSEEWEAKRVAYQQVHDKVSAQDIESVFKIWTLLNHEA